MNDKLYESVSNYTKYKLVDMLIEKHLDKKLKSLNAIEEIADDVMSTMALCGLKYHQELKEDFNNDE
jgi:hypothetical protein